MVLLKYMLLAGAVALFTVAMALIASIFFSWPQSPHRRGGKPDRAAQQPRKNTLLCWRASA